MNTIDFPRIKDFIKSLSENENILATSYFFLIPINYSLRPVALYITGLKVGNHLSFKIHKNYTSAKLFVSKAEKIIKDGGGIIQE